MNLLFYNTLLFLSLFVNNLGLTTADAVPVFYRAFFYLYSLYVYYDLYGLVEYPNSECVPH